MTAEEIRTYAMSHYFQPAKQLGTCPVEVRAGDVLKFFGAQARATQACAVLGSEEFCQTSRVKRLCITGSIPGVDTLFTFCWCGSHSVVVQRAAAA